MILPDVNTVLHTIWELKHEMNSPRNDGWTSSGMKEKLWEIKNCVDEALVNAPTYVDEKPYEDIYLMNRIKGKV
jgi:hypothetical protein